MKIILKAVFLLLLTVAMPVSALSIRSMKDANDLFRYIKADSWSIVGQNIIVRGGIHIPFDDMEIYADQAVINIANQDIEASGNIRFLRWNSVKTTVAPEQLSKIQRMEGVLVRINNVRGDIFGKQQLNVTVTGLTDNIHASRISGNLASGYFRMDDVQMRYSTFVCRAKSLERRPDGQIEAEDAEVSSCVYLEHNNAHYSFGAKKIKMTPKVTEFYELDNIVTDRGDYDVVFFNGVAKIYGVPVMWLPVFYKPKDISPGLFSTQFGKTSGWGYYVSLSKFFPLTEYPRSGVRIYNDYYEKRGVGYGLDADIVSEQSRTDIFAYSIYDVRPYETDDYDDYRLKVPHNRFDFRISNITHITPRLDFRGAFEYASDLYFVRDFFSSRYAANPQPATYAALEQQFDHFSASILFRPRLNDFYTVSEKMPEARIDIPRQQVLDTNLYYQGDMDASYNRMQWIEFDWDYNPRRKKTKITNVLSNYQTFRFDTTHFIYYPIRLDWLTVVPRAGFKMTAYGNSSETAVTTDDLLAMFMAADPECVSNYKFKNYDHNGGARVRSLGELGFEASTKIHNTWSNVRIPVMRVDGLRHIMRPYVNYTYIGSPSVDRDYLFYFDDMDRIERQHFFRFGLENRLQTRASDKKVRTFFSMENYWDLYLEDGAKLGKTEEFNRIGNFCTVLTTSPIERLTLRTSFIVDLGNNNYEMPEAERRGRKAGHPGINAEWLNRWNVSLTYEPVDDFKFNLSYIYKRPYSARSTYSMGSTLHQMDAGGYFDKYFDDYVELFTVGLSMPLTPDRRTMGAVRCTYDIEDGSFSDISFLVTRKFHCWELLGAFTVSRDCDDDDHEWETGFSVQARLVGLESPVQTRANELAGSAVKAFDDGNSKNQWL